MSLYYNPEISRESLTKERPPRLDEHLIELLGSPELETEILKGNVTLAMIRPALEAGSNIEGEDNKIANIIESSIKNLGIMAKFSLVFRPNIVDEFYTGAPKEIQLDLPPERDFEFSNRWEEFVSIMTKGPTTVLLLWSSKGDAVDAWRKQVGHWNIIDNRDPTTIRGMFGVDNYNNLVHGSDSKESVQREVGLIRNALYELCEMSSDS